MNDIKNPLNEKTLIDITEIETVNPKHFCQKCNDFTPFYQQKNRRKGNCKVCADKRRTSLCQCGNEKEKRALLCRDCRDKERANPFCSQCHTHLKVKGRWSLCKECRRKKFGVKDLEKKANASLKTRYNLTLEQMEQMFVSQDGKCAICLNEFEDTKHMHVDHNHITGKVRQLLCHKCNSAIGYFNENILTLTRAIDYLNKWNR